MARDLAAPPVAMEDETCDSREQRVADVIELSFTCLLRPGEVTTRTKGEANRQHDAPERSKYETCLAMGSLTFLDKKSEVIFKNGRLSTPSPDRQTSLATTHAQEAHFVVTTFNHQKNGEDGEMRTWARNDQYGTGDGVDVCPVRAASRIVESIIQEGGGAGT